MVSQHFQLPHYVKARPHFISKLKKQDIQVMHPCAKVLQSCPTLCDSVDYRPPGSSVHGILQAGVLECIAVPSSRGSSQPRDGIHVSYISCIGGQILYHQCHLGSPIQVIVINVSHSSLWSSPSMYIYQEAVMLKSHVYSINRIYRTFSFHPNTL